MSASKSSLPLIKGYLPVRVWLPSTDTSSNSLDETFCFVKEHRARSADDTRHQQQGSTLFVANAPIVPGVRTRIVLTSLLGRYGDIDRVTVVENPRLQHQQSEASLMLSTWTTTLASAPSFLRTVHSEGRFAHVVFTSPKEMKRAWRSLGEIMKGTSKQSKTTNDGRAPGLTLEKLEIQTLMDETERIARREAYVESDNDSSDESEKPPNESPKGILAVAARYRASCRRMSRAALLEECNRAMESYEDAEEEDRRAREASKSQADEDGFVTITHAKQSVGSKHELEQGVGAKRSRKKKKKASEGLTDFYRFQTRESRKKDVQDLRKRFEEDLAKVKKMKEERQYRPFAN